MNAFWITAFLVIGFGLMAFVVIGISKKGKK